MLQRASSKGDGEARFDGRAFRRSLGKTGRYVRNPTNDETSLALMEDHGVGYSSTGLIAQVKGGGEREGRERARGGESKDERERGAPRPTLPPHPAPHPPPPHPPPLPVQMRANNNTWTFAGLTVRLAEAYGYCWGVERAVQMAYEARRAWPDARVHVTNEIIHNPAVNGRLVEMGISIIQDVPGQGKDFSGVAPEDVVILPAFGASVQEMKLLSERGVQIVDTTCPWVAKVWNAVDNQARKDHTSIIHGKYSHEETVATASFAGTYLIVRDLEEARYVCDFILNGGDRAEFLEKFKKAVSAGFDPDTDLVRVGLANQTTMLRDETTAIGKLLEATQMRKWGPDALAQHYMVMDTICDATQERQDAVHALVGNAEKAGAAAPAAGPPDMVLVVGGFNSSNTSHLQEIPEARGVPSFWVDGARCVDVATNTVTHKLAHGEMVTTSPWIPAGPGAAPMTIGVTSGASTPDAAVEEVLDAIFRIRDPAFAGVAPDPSLAEKGVVRPSGHEE